LFPPDDERLSLETCRGGKINTLKKEKSASSWLKIHNALHDLTLIKMTVVRFVGTGSFVISYSNGHTK
jgi:hypothetical protein